MAITWLAASMAANTPGGHSSRVDTDKADQANIEADRADHGRMDLGVQGA